MAVGFVVKSKAHYNAAGALLKKERQQCLPTLSNLIRPSSVFDHAFAMKT
jgi:hypothetical protein